MSSDINSDDKFDDDVSSHEYDGIKELNNKAPGWVILTFIATIAFAGIYTIRYFGHPDNGMDQVSEYNKSSAAFDAEKKAMQEKNSGGAVLNTDDMIADGAKLYMEKGCLACHGMNGEGNAIGPNLTDNFWINGCSIDEINDVISEGRAEKGMTPYKSMMSEKQIKNLSTYILKSLVGSKPANAKAAQGVECTES